MQPVSTLVSSVPSDKTETHQSTAAERPTGRQRAQRVPDGRERGKDKKGTPPSNTVPYNSNNDNNDYFKLLRFGVDSLYLSYQGDLFPEVQERLTKLKQLAQHPEGKSVV